MREPLFSPSADTLLRVAMASLALFAIGVPTLAIVWARTAYATGRADPIQQPIAFDHRHHVRDDGIECRYCHSGVESTRFAGLPSTQLCMGCHAQVWSSAPVLAALRESAAKNTPIVWTRVNALPKHVFFDHAIHVKRGGGCETCHGQVDQMAQVTQVKPLTMRFCLDCHRNNHAVTHCTGCHR